MGAGITANVVMRAVRVSEKDPPIPVLVMFYEDFVRDFEGSVRVLMTFIKQKLGDAMPSLEDAITCALLGEERELSEHRIHRGSLNPFVDPASAVSKSKMVPKWCGRLAEYFYVDKWGPCDAGVTQRDRVKDLVVRPSPKVELGGKDVADAETCGS